MDLSSCAPSLIFGAQNDLRVDLDAVLNQKFESLQNLPARRIAHHFDARRGVGGVN